MQSAILAQRCKLSGPGLLNYAPLPRIIYEVLFANRKGTVKIVPFQCYKGAS